MVRHQRPPRAGSASTSANDDELDLQAFSESLYPEGLTIRDVADDGNCFFRAVSDQLYGSEERHIELRHRACEYLIRHKHRYQYFVNDEQSFDEYVADMRNDGVWADNLELQAISMDCGVNIRVHQSGNPSYDIRNHPAPDAPVIHLSYHFGEHYASVRPLRTAGLAVPAEHPPLSPPIRRRVSSSTDPKSTSSSSPRRPRRSNSTNAGAIWEDLGSECESIEKIVERTRQEAKAIRVKESNKNEEHAQAARDIERRMKDFNNLLCRIRQTVEHNRDAYARRFGAVTTGASSLSRRTVKRSSTVEPDEGELVSGSRRTDAVHNALGKTRAEVNDCWTDVQDLVKAVSGETLRTSKANKRKEQEMKKKERKERRRREQERIARGENLNQLAPRMGRQHELDIAI